MRTPQNRIEAAALALALMQTAQTPRQHAMAKDMVLDFADILADDEDLDHALSLARGMAAEIRGEEVVATT